MKDERTPEQKELCRKIFALVNTAEFNIKRTWLTGLNHPATIEYDAVINECVKNPTVEFSVELLNRMLKAVNEILAEPPP